MGDLVNCEVKLAKQESGRQSSEVAGPCGLALSLSPLLAAGLPSSPSIRSEAAQTEEVASVFHLTSLRRGAHWHKHSVSLSVDMLPPLLCPLSGFPQPALEKSKWHCPENCHCSLVRSWENTPAFEKENTELVEGISLNKGMVGAVALASQLANGWCHDNTAVGVCIQRGYSLKK